MKKKRLGFSTTVFMLLIVALLLVCSIGGFICHTKDNHENKLISIQNQHDLKTKITEVNNLLTKAGIEKFDKWVINANCGGADEFLGYQLNPDVRGLDPDTRGLMNVSTDQTKKLESVASSANLSIEAFSSVSYAVNGKGWTVMIGYDGSNPSISASVPSSQKPEGYPDGSLVCI